MTHEDIINKTIAFVKEELSDAEGGHDWWHIHRVYKNVELIAQSETVEPLTVKLAALLHDIADPKFHGGDEEIGPNKAVSFMKSIGTIEYSIIKHVEAIIRNMSFKNSLGTVSFHSKELEVVQDADRLDAIGAIGIARAFNYGGFKNRALYDPQVPPQLNMSKEEYKKSSAPTINHFYEKLLLLKDKMNTATAKDIAQNRHEFMESYLAHFYDEWNGKL